MTGTVTARPILFSGPMARALLEGRKTQTRRILKLPTTKGEDKRGEWEPSTVGGGGCFDRDRNPVPEHVCIWNNRVGTTLVCPYGQPGDLLWCRETWQLHSRATDVGKVVYRASEAASHTEFHELIPTSLIGDMQPKPFQEGWRSSLHMPRWASRLTLEISDVRVERLQGIGYCDALAEGSVPLSVRPIPEGMSLEEADRRGGEEAFRPIWESINGPGSWKANPWVWVIEFRVHQQNVDQFLAAQLATTSAKGEA